MMEERINPPPQRRSFVDEKLNAICDSALVTVLLLLGLAIPTAMLVVGSVYVNDCPIERFIPIYLIVAGAFGVFQTLFSSILRIKNQCQHKTDDNTVPNPLSGIISLFLFVWLITGCVWVYQTFPRVNTHNPAAVNYCHPGAYWLAFTLTTISLCMLLLLVLLLICLGLCVTIHHH